MTFPLGTTVRLVTLPPYLKTADPMPMLRPPDLLAIADTGIILECRPANYWVVKFPRGTFLIDAQYLEPLPLPENGEISHRRE